MKNTIYLSFPHCPFKNNFDEFGGAFSTAENL